MIPADCTERVFVSSLKLRSLDLRVPMCPQTAQYFVICDTGVPLGRAFIDIRGCQMIFTKEPENLGGMPQIDHLQTIFNI